MLYHNVQVMARSLHVVDSVAAATAAAVAAWYSIPGGDAARGPWVVNISVFAGAVFVAFMVVAERLHIYFARRTEELARELTALAEVALYASGLACVATQVAGFDLPAASYLWALGAALALLLGLRVTMRWLVRLWRRHGDDHRVWLIVGHNDRAAALARTVLANPHFGIRIEEIVNIARDGQVNDPPAAFGEAPLSAIPLRVLPDAGAIRALVSTRVVDEVVVTLPVRSCYDQIHQILEVCCACGISLKFGPEVFEKPGFFTEVSHVGGIPMVTHYSGPANYRLLMAKRAIDLLGSALGLVLLSPVLLAIGVAVRLSSPGPVFFRQARVGLHGRHFQMVKFRSMVTDAPRLKDEALNEVDGTAYKIRNDSRVTPFGRWLRKYHLDELPQLWNVFVGDMSLVGPRPFPVSQATGFELWQRRRLTMPPGMTCYWQLIDDPTQPFSKWMELDMAYIDRWSIWLDLQLIFRTVFSVARGRGW